MYSSLCEKKDLCPSCMAQISIPSFLSRNDKRQTFPKLEISRRQYYFFSHDASPLKERGIFFRPVILLPI